MPDMEYGPHRYIGKRAIHLNDMVLGRVVKVKEDKDHERWDIIVLDKEVGGHRHYFAIEDDDQRFFGFDMFADWLNKYSTQLK